MKTSTTSKTASKNFFKAAILIIFAVCFTVSLKAQYAQQWVSNINSSYLSSITSDPNGNVYVSAGNKLVKYSVSGAQQFVQDYPGHTVMTTESDGNYIYVSGRVSNSEIFIKKISFSGTEVFYKVKNLTPGSYCGIYSIAIDGSGNIYVGGFTTPAGQLASGLLVKFDSNGNEMWVGGDYYAPISKIDLDNQGNVFTSGVRQNQAAAYHYQFCHKYTAAGSLVWAKNSAQGYASTSDMCTDIYGNIFLTSSNGIYKYATNGTLLWSILSFQGSSIAMDNNNSIIVSGKIYQGATGDDICTIKLDQNGSEQWRKIYASAGNTDHSTKVSINNANIIFVAGRCGQTTQNSDICLIRYSNSGQQLSVNIYDSPTNQQDSPTGFTIINNNSAAVTGYSGTGVAVTIKYSDLTGISSTNNEIPEGFNLSQNYPNPFNPSTKISFSIPKSSFVKMVVYDISGKEVETMVNENLNAGSFEVDFNAAKLTSGVYFYRIMADGFTETKKMILTK